MPSTNSSIKPRVVIDTNVFVSAFLAGGRPQKIINLWLEGRIVVLLSPFLLTEILNTLAKFGFTQTDLINLQAILEEHTLKIIPKKQAKVCRDPKDNQVLDLAVAGQADYLVTGDKDLLTLKEFHATKILKPAEFPKRREGLSS